MPINPIMIEIDIERIVDMGRQADAIVAVGNASYTLIFQRPLEPGADVVLHSAMKYLGRYSDVLVDAVIVSREGLAGELVARLDVAGATLGLFDNWLLMREMKTLVPRMECHRDNTRKITAALEESPLIDHVHYTGRGGMLSFVPNESVNVPRVLGLIRLFTFVEPLDGVESLVTYPAVQAHTDVSREG